MKTTEKIQYINERLSFLNEKILKNAIYVLELKKIGNKYCVVATKEGVNAPLHIAPYNSYDDVMASIKFLEFILRRDVYAKNKD